MNKHFFHCQQRALPKKELVGCLVKCGERDEILADGRPRHGIIYNSRDYSICVYDGYMCVQRRDQKPARDWRDLQKIKNSIWGDASVAVEVFPPQENVFDMANTTWLWRMPDEFDVRQGRWAHE
jgi:hypothetical protein